MPEYYINPAKCCCCSLRTATIVVGSLSMVFALIFLGLTAGFSRGMKSPSYCTTSCIDSECTTKCPTVTGEEIMISNILAILAITNAVEFVMSISLIWSANKRYMFWVTGWLLATASWILLHGTVAVSLLFATTQVLVIILVSVLGIFTFGMAILAFLTVLSLRKEMTNAASQSQE